MYSITTLLWYSESEPKPHTTFTLECFRQHMDI
jgi:hypothetical protein